MKRVKQFLTISMVVSALLALSISATFAQGPVGTIFTYQGRLTDSGVPANTSKDFEFKLFSTVVAGTPLGTYTRNDVNVINGLFVVDLDFGINPFNGQSLYLEVGVRPWDSTGAYTKLAPRQKLTPTPYAMFSSAPWVTNGSNINYANGNVGIGTPNPTSKLEIVAQDGLAITGYQPFLTLRDANASNKRGFIQSTNGDIHLIPESFAGSSSAMTLKNVTGNIGIGTATPSDKLTVVTATANFGFVHTDGNIVVGSWVGTGGGTPAGGWYGTRTNHPLHLFANNGSASLTVETNGNVTAAHTLSAAVVQIRGGSDIAENFTATDAITPEAGSVMVIDELAEGKLKLSTTAYDKKVVGIISGAGNVKPGMTLQQDGVLEGDLPVTVVGRVYCKAEALTSPIQAGDLLTTSGLPGYCMKASDNTRTQGAIIGKALGSLKTGKGLVLVLVTLQ